MTESIHDGPEPLQFGQYFRWEDHVRPGLEQIMDSVRQSYPEGILSHLRDAHYLDVLRNHRLIYHNLKWVVKSLQEDSRHRGMAFRYGGNLGFVAMRVHYRGKIPELTEEICKTHNLRLPVMDAPSKDWISHVLRLGQYEVEHDSLLEEIGAAYEPEILTDASYADSGKDYRAGLGFMKYMIGGVEIYYQRQAALQELSALKEIYGGELQGALSDDDLRKLLDQE